MVSHHKEERHKNGPRGVVECIEGRKCSHTIDGNGNNLREGEAIGTLEGGDLASGVDLEVLSAGVELSSRVGLSLNQLQIEVVVLSSDQDGDGATVVLKNIRH